MSTAAWIYYLAVVSVMSVITFCVYYWDKRAAANRQWRVPESRLHLLALLGGWVGAILAQKLIRHKNQKFGFKIITWLVSAIHLAVITWLLLKGTS